MTADDAGPDSGEGPLRESERRGPGGPDLYTLLGWMEVELALDTDVTVDAAHAVLSDLVERAFGRRVFERVAEALTAEGRDPDDLAGLRADELLAGRVLARLRARRGEDDVSPDPLDSVHEWTAYAPGERRRPVRRAVRDRRRATALADCFPGQRPRRVAGRRAQERG